MSVNFVTVPADALQVELTSESVIGATWRQVAIAVWHQRMRVDDVRNLSRMLNRWESTNGSGLVLLQVFENSCEKLEPKALEAIEDLLGGHQSFIRGSGMIFEEGNSMRSASFHAVVVRHEMLFRQQFPSRAFGSLSDAATWASERLVGRPQQFEFGMELLRVFSELRQPFMRRIGSSPRVDNEPQLSSAELPARTADDSRPISIEPDSPSTSTSFEMSPPPPRPTPVPSSAESGPLRLRPSRPSGPLTADFRSTNSVLILRQNAKTPTDDDWNRFLAELASLRPRFSRMRAICFTDGGGPNAEQRKRLTAALGGSTIQAAIVTDKISVRFVVASVALFNKTIRSFSRRETPDAYSWLRFSDQEIQTVESLVAELDKTVG